MHGRTDSESKEKHGVWDPMPELTLTSPYVHCRDDFNTFTMGNPMPESALSPSQGLWIWPLAAAILQAGKHHDQVGQESSVSILCVSNPSDGK
jgi:hypothetical protein